MLDLDSTRTVAEARAASTVVILRAGTAGEAEVFMLKRSGRSGFMAGAYVFPGGRVDDADGEIEVRHVEGAAIALAEPAEVAVPLYVAAIRETLEEAGVLLGHDIDARELSKELNAGDTSFAELLRARGLQLDLMTIRPFARWITPNAERRRYDTRFFITVVGADQTAEHDGHETVEHRWWTAREAIAAFEAREIMLAPPTLRTLEHLRDLRTAEAAFDHLGERPPRPVQPELLATNPPSLALPGDPEHPVRAAIVGEPTRFCLKTWTWLTP